jgi:hypothetical protein
MIEDEIREIVSDRADEGERLNALVDEFRRGRSQGVLDGAGKTVRLDRMFLFVPLDLAKSLP